MRLRADACLHALGAAALAIAICGCGSGGPAEPERAVAFGAVQYDGKPVVDGQIRFIPTNGQVAGAPIRDGKYRVDFEGGVPVGTSKVEVEAYEKSRNSVVVSATGQTIEESRQILPPKYNTQSTLSANIEAGKENDCSFDLQK
ncbi:MAG: hypothetical protein HUU20_27755 [Pirellulales bacterium]|nr:hypothetical protein [Pirellulales bacterium]